MVGVRYTLLWPEDQFGLAPTGASIRTRLRASCRRTDARKKRERSLAGPRNSSAELFVYAYPNVVGMNVRQGDSSLLGTGKMARSGIHPGGLAAPRSSIHIHSVDVITSWLNQHIDTNTNQCFAVAPSPFSTPRDAPGLILSTS